MHFFCKLHPPRASFAHDMTPEEARLMQAHAAYWQEWLAKGHVMAFGLVGDPSGPYGVGIVEFDSPEAARAFADGDPTLTTGVGFRLDVHPMPFGASTRPQGAR
jgi:uncharacterized protein